MLKRFVLTAALGISLNNPIVLTNDAGYSTSIAAGTIFATDGVGGTGSLSSEAIGVSHGIRSGQLQANEYGVWLALTPSNLAAMNSQFDGSLAVSDGTSGYEYGKLYIRVNGIWVRP